MPTDRRGFLGMSIALPFIPLDLREGPPPEPIGPASQYAYILKRFPIEEILHVIVEACSTHQSVFPLEPEVEVALLRQESLFNPSAISLAGAVGIAQFIPETARDEYGMKVLVTEDYTEGVRLRKRFLDENRKVSAALRENDFEKVKRHKLRTDELGKETETKFVRYKIELESLIIGTSASERMAIDQRLDPELAIRNGVRHLAEVSRACSDRFGGSVRHNVLRGLAAYNAGLDQVFKFDGMPFLFQTVDYVRKIMVMYDQLMSDRKL